MFLEAQYKEHFKLLGLKNPIFASKYISWESQKELFYWYGSYVVAVASGYWVENMYNADTYSKTYNCRRVNQKHYWR